MTTGGSGYELVRQRQFQKLWSANLLVNLGTPDGFFGTAVVLVRRYPIPDGS